MARPPSVVIIGGGHAGGCVAGALRQGGFVGSILVIGDELHPPYERPPLSKDFLVGAPPIGSVYLRSAPSYAELDIELMMGTEAVAIDPAARRVALDSGSEHPYDILILATGARVRRLGVPGAELDGVHYLRGIDDALALQAKLAPGLRVAVVGGGFIGLEVAASARQRGARVSVIEAESTLLQRMLPREIGEFLAEIHRANDVELHFGTTAAGIEGAGRVERVILSDGTALEADIVVIGIGVAPNTGLAEAAGLEVGDGIVVNEFGETSATGIFAIGDVASHPNSLFRRRWRLESWQNAQNQALAVAKVICGTRAPYAEVPWFWSDQYDINMQMAGLVTDGGNAVMRGSMEARSFATFYVKDTAIVGVVGVNRPRDVRVARQLIGMRAEVDPRHLADDGLRLNQLLRPQ